MIDLVSRESVTSDRPGIPRLNALSGIVDAVSRVYAIPPSSITGRSRTKTIAEARMLVCLLARRCTRLSSTEIGLVIERDHTTALTLIKSAERQQARDPWFAAVASALIDQFGARP